MAKKIGLFVGSLRKESYNLKLAKNLMKLFPADYDTEIIPIGQLEMYNQDFDDENRAPESWKAFREKLGTIDGAIFITPEYNRSVPAVLKNAIDVGSRPYGQNKWNGVPAAVVSSSIGAISGFGANHHLRQSLTFVNMPTLAQPEVYIASVQDLLNPDGTLKNEGTTQFLQNFVDKFIEHVGLYK